MDNTTKFLTYLDSEISLCKSQLMLMKARKVSTKGSTQQAMCDQLRAVRLTFLNTFKD